MLTYRRDRDGIERASVAIWMRFSEEQICALEALANPVNLTFRELLWGLTRSGVDTVLEAQTQQ